MSLWRPTVDWPELVFRSAAVYVTLALLLRLTGKRQIGQLGLLDLVLVLLVANAVQNAMVGPDTSLTGGLVAMTALVVTDWIANRLGLRMPLVRRLFVSAPTLLVHDGDYIIGNMQREGVAKDEVDSQIREHGFEDVSQVHSATLEPDGTISIVPMSAAVIRGRRRVRQFRRQ